MGLVVAGGMECRASHLRFTAEVRYTDWNRRFLDVLARHVGFLGLDIYQSPGSYLYLLIGLGWH